MLFRTTSIPSTIPKCLRLTSPPTIMRPAPIPQSPRQPDHIAALASTAPEPFVTSPGHGNYRNLRPPIDPHLSPRRDHSPFPNPPSLCSTSPNPNFLLGYSSARSRRPPKALSPRRNAGPRRHARGLGPSGSRELRMLAKSGKGDAAG
jgi:hypothetical protein